MKINGITGETECCDNCGDRLVSKHYYPITTLTADIETANKGESAILCLGCYCNYSNEVPSGFKPIEKLTYCNECGEGHPVKDIGIVFGGICCIDCAEGMGEKLKMRGMPQ